MIAKKLQISGVPFAKAIPTDSATSKQENKIVLIANAILIAPNQRQKCKISTTADAVKIVLSMTPEWKAQDRHQRHCKAKRFKYKTGKHKIFAIAKAIPMIFPYTTGQRSRRSSPSTKPSQPQGL